MMRHEKSRRQRSRAGLWANPLWRWAALLLPPALALLALFLLFSLARASGQRAPAGNLCVKPGGGGGCQASINAALALAQPNDTIRVAAGVYNENVVISQTVSLEGGWSPDFSSRDLSAFLSVILPADDHQSVVTIQGKSGNTGAVSPTLEGFVITGGRADLGSNHGGGLRVVDSDAWVISNTIQNNVAFLLGGGVWVQRGAPTLQGNRILDNQTVGLGQDAHGGGVQLENSTAVLLGNLIAGNVVSGTQAYGGGLEINGSGGGEVLLSGNTFQDNTATSLTPQNAFGGGLALVSGQARLDDTGVISNSATDGGGIFIGGKFEDCCNLSGRGSRIDSNQAVRGGGLAIEGDVDDCCQFSGSGTEVKENSATDGGGLYNDDQFASILGGLFISNTASADGGGLLLTPGAGISLTNSAAVGNVAVQDGGAIHNSGLISLTGTTVSGNSASGMGGGVYNDDFVNLVNVTVSDNDSADGAGFFNGATIAIQNSLVALNIGDNCLGAGLFSLGHNLEDGGTCAMGHASDMSNIPAALATLQDNGGTTPTHALMAGSPAIDNGDNSACGPTDQRGAPRPYDGDGDSVAVCDIGAYEFGAPIAWIFFPIVRR